MEGADVFRRYIIESEDETDMTEEETLALKRFGLEKNSEFLALNVLMFGDWVQGGEYYPHDGDFVRDGAAIGANQHLKCLQFTRNYVVPLRSYKKFFQGVAKNRSIEVLAFDRNFDHGGGEAFQILTEFFVHNKNFRELIVNDVMDNPTIKV